MLHLDPERLAALADDEPTADEATHLAGCPACAREYAAYAELTALAARERLAVLGRPLTDWRTLAARLQDDRLIAAPAAAARGRWRGWMQVAAGVVLALGGLTVGRATAARPLPVLSALGGTSTPGATLASTTDTTRALVNVQDALALMRRAEGDYRIAAAFVAAHDTTARGTSGVDLYRQRLAALDRVSDAALAAANEAPADPVVNQYLIAARAAREATLQQLNGSLPAGMSLASY